MEQKKALKNFDIKKQKRTDRLFFVFVFFFKLM